MSRGWPIVYIEGSLCTGYDFQIKLVLLFLKIFFVLTNSVDPDEMPHVCKSTRLGVTSIQRVKQMVLEYTGTHFVILILKCQKGQKV